MVQDVSTKAQAILEEIKSLPPQEFQAVWQQVNQLAAQTEKLSSATARVSDEEFDAALDEVTGCTAGSDSLQRLLDDRRLDRERDEAWLEARKQKRARG
ncbi:MAG: hypothetical protein QOJ40_79 [Verrucomicrobiota bacterium]